MATERSRSKHRVFAEVFDPDNKLRLDYALDYVKAMTKEPLEIQVKWLVELYDELLDTANSNMRLPTRGAVRTNGLDPEDVGDPCSSCGRALLWDRHEEMVYCQNDWHHG